MLQWLRKLPTFFVPVFIYFLQCMCRCHSFTCWYTFRVHSDNCFVFCVLSHVWFLYIKGDSSELHFVPGQVSYDSANRFLQCCIIYCDNVVDIRELSSFVFLFFFNKFNKMNIQHLLSGIEIRILKFNFVFISL